MKNKKINKKLILAIIFILSIKFIYSDSIPLGIKVDYPELKFNTQNTYLNYNVNFKFFYIYFIGIAILLIYLDYKNSELFKWLYSHIFSKLKTKSLINETNKDQKKIIIYLSILSLILFSTYLSIYSYKILYSNLIDSFMIIFNFLLFELIFIVLFNLLISIIFSVSKLIKQNISLYLIFLSYTVLPSYFFSFITYYIKNIFIIKLLFKIFIALIVMFYTIKIIRQLQTFKEQGFSIFYFILYICSAEIIPVLIFLSVIN